MDVKQAEDWLFLWCADKPPATQAPECERVRDQFGQKVTLCKSSWTLGFLLSDGIPCKLSLPTAWPLSLIEPTL